jgi:hypothetical protein
LTEMTPEIQITKGRLAEQARVAIKAQAL